VDVRWRPLVSVAVVTHLITHPDQWALGVCVAVTLPSRWPLAVAGYPFMPPAGKGIARLASSDDTGHCPSCRHAVTLCLDGSTVAHKTGTGHCPGSGKLPAADAPLTCWLPVRGGLTPHGLRHSHKTWMAEVGIPEILAEQRLGHEVPGMRGLYAHASQRMRDKLTDALQARWEESLRERAAVVPHSPVPLLDGLLASHREARLPATRDPREVDLPNSSQNDEDPIPQGG
jgi:hypothetical protein